MRDDAVRLVGDAPQGTGLVVEAPREAEVLRFLSAGFSNKEVARRLTVSVRTVETHRDRPVPRRPSMRDDAVRLVGDAPQGTGLVVEDRRQADLAADRPPRDATLRAPPDVSPLALPLLALPPTERFFFAPQ
jgi:hypothetical protein